MFVRIATFTGGDAEALRRLNEERMSSGEMNPPAGLRRAMVLQGDKRLFLSFFDTRDEVAAAEQRFEATGNEVPEEIRGTRVGVDVYEVLFDGELS